MKTLIRPFLLVCLFVCNRATHAQVPVFNSLPGAQSVILLDFDGHTVSGTSWNWNGPIYCGPSGLNPEAITEIYKRIAEDYRPFDINVTTDSTKFLSAPLNKRQRIIFTITHEWYGLVGGVSMVGSFIWGDDTPAYVFTSLLGFNNKKIGEAGSHEAGHCLGLYHQVVFDANCNQVAEYNPGTGSGEIGWAPIMGVGYYQNMTVWHYGPNYTGCASSQDELHLITSQNNIGFRPDDHSSEFKHADNVSVTNNQFLIEGIIETSQDMDYFKINIRNDAQLVVNAFPFSLGQDNTGSNLDMEISLYDRRKELVAIYNPGSILNSVIDTFMNSGTYYLKVEGKGNAFTPDYASLGAYTLQGSLNNSLRQQERIYLNRSLEAGFHVFDWSTDEINGIEKQVLEFSFDGKTFQPVAELAGHIREYAYRPATEKELMYRLRIFYRNGEQRLSNHVILKGSQNPTRPRLQGNHIGNELVIQSPDLYDYYISDMQGNIQLRGKAGKGMHSINIPFIAPGIYMIRFSKGSEVFTEKFIRK